MFSDAVMGRVELVPVNRKHAAAMFSVISDTSLYTFTGGEPPQSLAEVEEWFTALESGISPDGSEKWLTWIVQGIEFDTPIGYVQATIEGNTAEVSWLIGSRWQGNGYAIEAVGALMSWLADNQIVEVTAHIQPQHRASQRIARRFHLKPSGTYHEGEEVWRKP